MDIPNAISSQELEDGVMHSDLRDGQMIEKSGQDPAHANRSPWQEEAVEIWMNDTYGHAGGTSYPNPLQKSSLENRSETQSPKDGLIKFSETWKTCLTPMKREYCQQLIVAMIESGYTSWPTPSARDWKDLSSRE